VPEEEEEEGGERRSAPALALRTEEQDPEQESLILNPPIVNQPDKLSKVTERKDTST